MWIVFDQKYRNSYVFGAGLFPRQPIPGSWIKAGIAHSGEVVSLVPFRQQGDIRQPAFALLFTGMDAERGQAVTQQGFQSVRTGSRRSLFFSG